MNRKIVWFSIISIFSILVLMPVISLAQSGNLQNQSPTSSTTTSKEQEDIFLLGDILGWVATIFWIAAAFFIFVAAFKYLTAAGDPTKVKAASTMLLYAVVAIAVAIISYGLPLFVGNFLE